MAVICRKLLGEENPLGGVTLMVDVPAALGSNALDVFDESPLLNRTGLPVIVPTLPFELVIVTSIDSPPRNACC